MTSAQCCIRTTNVKGLLTALNAIKAGNKQHCTVVLGADGMSVKSEDESKSMQSSVFLRPELFREYCCPGARRTFGLHLASLVDTLSVFTSSTPGAELELHYPGPNSELMLQMQESGDGCAACVYARIDSVVQPTPSDLTDYWEDPSSYFLMQGAVLKEAIDDLDWPGACVAIEVQRDPAKIVLTSLGIPGTLQICLPVDSLSGFKCAAPALRHSYKYKHLQAALSHIPHHKEPANVSTKVTFDSNGMLKVTHMINLQGAVDAPLPGPAPTSYLESQTRTAGSGRVGVVQFVILPLDEGAGEDEPFGGR